MAEVRRLPELLEEIERGHILIPRFQRPMVWAKDLRLALLDSILEGIPIGAITLWRTDAVKMPATDRLGPFLLPVPDADAPVHDYVLDGEQRLGTLYLALIGAPESEPNAERAEAFHVFYDLRTRMFTTGADLKVVLPHHLPLIDILRSAHLIKFQRELMAAEDRSPHIDPEDLVELSDDIARVFREHQVFVQRVVTNDLGLVTRAFKRINAHRVEMSALHMVNALTWSPRFNLLGRLQEMKDGAFAELGWEGLDDDFILRTCEVALDKAVYDDDFSEVGDALRKNPAILNDVEAHLCNAAHFFRRYCSIRVPHVVPYRTQIVLLAGAFRDFRQPTEEALYRLRDWFWLTTYTETFQRNVSESRFSQLLEDVRTLARGEMLDPPHGKPPTRRRLPRFDFRHARARGLALLMVKQKPREPHDPSREGTLAHGSRLLAEHRTRGMAQLVTSTMANQPAASGSPGARVLVRPESVGAMRKLLQSAAPPPDDFLRSHVISHAAWQAFRDGDYASFVKLREEELNRMEEHRFRAIVHRIYPALDERDATGEAAGPDLSGG